MTMLPPPSEAPFSIYLDLADQLRSAFADPDRSAALIRLALHSPPLSIEQIDRLRAEADRVI